MNQYHIHRSRLSSFISGMLETGLEYLLEYVFNIDMKETEERLIKSIKEKEFSAIVCNSEELGYELIKKFKEAEIKNPEDISIVGFNSMPAPDGLQRLASMRNSSEQIGITAVMALKERIAHQDANTENIY